MARRPARQLITLSCSVCHRRNYVTERSVATQAAKISLRKFCPWCRKTTAHREVR